MRNNKTDCFAYRFDGKVARCEALNKVNCAKCPFYKRADTVEYYETVYQGVKVYGYNDAKRGQLARLMDLRTEIERQIRVLEG